MSNPNVPAVAPAERDAGLMAHGAALGGAVIELFTGVPFLGLAGALVAWLATRRRGDFADDQGREAVRFQVFLSLWAIAIISVSLLLFGTGAFMLVVLAGFGIAILSVVCPVLGLVKVNKSERYRYPFTFSPRRGK
jgi:uncharacterized protein